MATTFDISIQSKPPVLRGLSPSMGLSATGLFASKLISATGCHHFKVVLRCVLEGDDLGASLHVVASHCERAPALPRNGNSIRSVVKGRSDGRRRTRADDTDGRAAKRLGIKKDDSVNWS